MLRQSVSAIILACCLIARAAGPSGSDAVRAFKDFYRTELERCGVVGSSVLVVYDGKTVLRDVYGDANRAEHQPVDEDTTFHWASITKTFTAIAIVQLRDHGLLQLDDPVVKYVPELRAIHDPYGPIDAITIRHLLTHSGGFRSSTWPWSDGKEWEPFEPTKWSQVAAMLPYTEVLFQPGARHSYSNLGVVFLGQIIERLSGDGYEVYIDKNILKPLGMHASYFDRAPYYLLKHRAAGYLLSKGVLTGAPFNFDSGITVSNSGLNSPFPDMEKYLRFLLGIPEPGNHYEDVLKRGSLEEMFHGQMEIQQSDSSQTVAAGRKNAIGLGFFLDERDERLYIGHGGQQGGFISHFYLDPLHRNGYLVAFNTDSSDAETNTQRLDARLRDYLFANVFTASSKQSKSQPKH